VFTVTRKREEPLPKYDRRDLANKEASKYPTSMYNSASPMLTE